MINAFRTNLAAKRAELGKDDKGFTLIELLVVVLIIGILTAIAVPVFIGQQEQAKDAAAKSDIGVLKVALVSYATANGGTYTTTVTDLADYGYVASSGVTDHTITVGANGAFCISATSASTKVFALTNTLSAAQGSCGTGGVFTAAS